MAESGSEPTAADLLIQTNKDEPPLPAEPVSKELIVTTTTEGSEVRAEVLSSNGAADSRLPTKVLEEEATPTPPESPSLSSENETVTAGTTEEESLSDLLRHAKTDGGRETGPDLDLEDSSSAVTAGCSDDQRESTDSASFSIPSLELSDGLTGNSLDVEDGLSSSQSALAVDASSPSTEVPGLKDDEMLEAAGETSPRGLCVHMNTVCVCVCDGVVLPSTGGAVAAAAPPASSSAAPPEAGPSMPAYYLVKWITWKEKKTPIITQSENGPCPLLAIMNTLFLRWKGHLYLLVTDQGFLQEERLVWESLHNVEGDGNFCDSDFRLCHPPQRAPPSAALPPSAQEQQRQIDQVRGQGSQQGGARRRDKDSDCVVL
ncbi:Ubiquitin carboxyl-terminal hydrolase MINDY-1 [Nibea albiflora]|uniref:Ubiquitin carboxyl-terminal hydrolase MINDY-1 n=1 Tax=Nibea albiflora TaxID=240163 RepID=A0ACB7ERX8_NIBAL|nr:Ubiquitin carboxyl-terminal hydrolase MINDY-1 [Nibea albiflora]